MGSCHSQTNKNKKLLNAPKIKNEINPNINSKSLLITPQTESKKEISFSQNLMSGQEFIPEESIEDLSIENELNIINIPYHFKEDSKSFAASKKANFLDYH